MLCPWSVTDSGNWRITVEEVEREALALNLSTYKLKKTINYNLSQLKKAYSDEVRLENYRQSLRLEGFDTTADSFNPNLLTKSGRLQLRSQLKKNLTR